MNRRIRRWDGEGIVEVGVVFGTSGMVSVVEGTNGSLKIWSLVVVGRKNWKGKELEEGDWIWNGKCCS